MNPEIIGRYLLYSILSIALSWMLYLFLSINVTTQLDKEDMTKTGLLTYIAISIPVLGLVYVSILIIAEITIWFWKYWNRLDDE